MKIRGTFHINTQIWGSNGTVGRGLWWSQVTQKRERSGPEFSGCVLQTPGRQLGLSRMSNFIFFLIRKIAKLK